MRWHRNIPTGIRSAPNIEEVLNFGHAMKSSSPTVNIVLLAALWLASGCLFIPTPKARPLEGTEVKQADLAFLLPGQTTREEAVRTLGKPTVSWRDENILVYRWVKCRGVLLWVIAGYNSAQAGLIDVPQEFAFLIKFDGNDRYQASEVLEKPPLKSFGKFLLEWRDQHACGRQPQERAL